MSNETHPNIEECRGYLHTNPSRSSYLWKFQGIPFNLFLNTIAVLIIILLWIVMDLVTKCMRKKGVPIFALHRSTGSDCPKLTLRSFIFMENWEFAQRAGLDGVAYLRTLIYNMCQLLSMLPFVVIALPVYYRGGKTSSMFARLTITNLGLSDSEGPWILWALAVNCSVFYLISIWLRFQYAYQWPKTSRICRMWNPRAHASNSEHRSSSASDSLTEREQSISGALVDKSTKQVLCQCNLVNQIPNVLMLSDIPQQPFNEVKKNLLSYFASFDPPVNVRWIQPVQDVHQVVKQERLKLELEACLRLADEEFDRTGHEPIYNHCPCGSGSYSCLRGLCCCCCPCVRASQMQSRWAREVYRDRISVYNIYLEAQYRRLDSLSPDSVAQMATGVMFVGLDSASDALRVATEFSIYLQRAIPMDYTLHVNTESACSILARRIKMFANPKHAKHYASAPFGHLQLAPLPSEILWSNLMTVGYRSCGWWIIQMIKSVGIFLAALLLTSPTYLLLLFNSVRSSDWLTFRYGFIVYQWVPALILVSAAGLVKQLIIVSEAWTKHGTYGGREKVGQRSLFLFLVISVLIFPSLGVTGLPFLIERLAGQRGEVKPLRLECIFSPDSAALFINYVITSALLGCAIGLLQLGRWFWFLVCRMFTVHSTAEARFLAEENAGPFPFRERYASMNLIQTIVVAYTPISPVILFFGLFYFVCDYIVCRYSLLRIYTPQWFDDGHGLEPKAQFEGADRVYHLTWLIQSNNLAMSGICLASLNLCFFFALRMGIVSTRPVTIAFLVLAAILFAICLLLTVLSNGRCLRFGFLRCASGSSSSSSGQPENYDQTEFHRTKEDFPDDSGVRSASSVNGTITFTEQSYTATYFRQSKFVSKSG